MDALKNAGGFHSQEVEGWTASSFGIGKMVVSQEEGQSGHDLFNVRHILAGTYHFEESLWIGHTRKCGQPLQRSKNTIGGLDC